MKSAYVKPTMMFEIFRANESIAACWKNYKVGEQFYAGGACSWGDGKLDFSGEALDNLYDHITGEALHATVSWSGDSQIHPSQQGLSAVDAHIHSGFLGLTVTNQSNTFAIYTDGTNYYSLYDYTTTEHPNASV